MSKRTCPVRHCEFKRGNLPCMFFFQYRDGSVSCPNIKRFKLAATAAQLEKEVGNGEKR
nr:MAG TPA: hypothetical protein [Caudoviricetes sp.]